MEDGSTKDGIPMKSIDLSVPKAAAPLNAVEPVSPGIPASIPTAPVKPNFEAPAPAQAPPSETIPAEKK
jgi:hypothetical protein